MNRANAIKNKDDICRFAEWLKNYKLKYYVIFIVAINSGLRISDVLALNVGNVRNRDYIVLHERKTGKYKCFPINEVARKAIDEYMKAEKSDACDDEPLFLGKKHCRLDRVQVYRIIRRCAQALNIQGVISCHSTRKSFGYAHYKQYNDIGLLQTILNHSSSAITLRYIDVTQEEIDKSYLNLDLGL